MFTESPLAPDREVRLDAQAGHYLHRVLKLRAGDPLVLFNGDGHDYAAELLSNRRDEVPLRITARLPAVPEPGLRVTLAQAVGKGDRMDYALQKATELGAVAFQPLFTERTEVRLTGTRLERREAHWRRVIISACEQSGRATLPGLHAAKSLDEWLAEPLEGDRFLLDPTADDSLCGSAPHGPPVTVIIGPEGGFSDQEVRGMALAGVRAVRLGPRVLRTETAGPAAVAVLQALHGDLR